MEEKKLNIETRNLAICALLSIVTFGIYYIYWFTLVARNVRNLKEDDGSIVGETLCFALVPFYSWYWFYTRPKEISSYSKKWGWSIEDNSLSCLLIAICASGMISLLIVQNSFNELKGLISKEKLDEGRNI